MKILGVYYGLTDIFLSISDDMELTARPLAPIAHKNWIIAKAALQDIIQEHNIDKFIFVIPLNRKAEASKKSSKNIAFSEFLKKGFCLPVELYEAICSFPTTKHSQQKTKKEQLIANLLLQSFLDKRYLEKQSQLDKY